MAISATWIFTARDGTSAIVDIGGLDVTNSRLAFPTRNARQWLTAACDAMLLGVMTALLFGWLVVRADTVPSSNAERPPTWREALAYSLPLALTSVASLIVFYPGMMTSDSLDQWRQAGQMSFNDAHPLLYGLFMVGMRLLWDSPAAVAGVQMLLFATASGWLVATIRHAVEAPRRTAWASAWLIALFPLLPLTAITLWKDVPYATAVIALTAFVVTRLGPVTTERLSARATIALSLLMFCAMALRHNGPPVAFAAALVLFFVASHSRLRVVVAAVAAVAMMVLLKGPISDAAGIERKPVSYVLYSHHIAAHLAAKHLPANPADRALLQQLNRKESDWAYNCATVNPIVFNPHFDARNAMAHDKDLLRILLDLARTRPDIEFDHGLCSSALIWRLRDSPLDPLYLSGVGLWAPQGEVKWITGKAGDPVQHSLSPALAQFVGKMVLLPGMEAAFRPALYMYLLIFACGVAVVRRHDRKLWLLLSLPRGPYGVSCDLDRCPRRTLSAPALRHHAWRTSVADCCASLQSGAVRTAVAMKFVRPAPTILIASIVAGVILAIGSLFTWRSFANLPPMIAGVVFLCCSVLLSGAMLTILQRTRSRWSAAGLRSRVLWLSACTLAGWLLTWMIPLPPAPAPGTPFSVEVVSLGEHSDASKGAESLGTIGGGWAHDGAR
jgi:hypothetical protein